MHHFPILEGVEGVLVSVQVDEDDEWSSWKAELRSSRQWRQMRQCMR
jgi:hypothetical protein